MALNPYEILQVAYHAETEVIEAAYRRLARKYHPDKDPSPEANSRMQRINWAYEILRDPVKRAQYDRKIKYQKSRAETGFKAASGTPPPKSRTYSSSSKSSSEGKTSSSSFSQSSTKRSSSHTSPRATYTPPKKKSRALWWVLGVIGLLIIVSWLNNSGNDASSVPSKTSTPSSSTSSGWKQASKSEREEAIWMLLNLMVEDSRYDPTTSVVHTYLPYIDVNLDNSRLTYTVWKDIYDADDFVNLAADLILYSAVVINQSEALNKSLTYIEVVNPGPENTSATLFVSGRSNISSISSGETSVFDLMEADVDWGDVSDPDYDGLEATGCPQGCTSHIIGCDIKGNISIDTGEKIYHVPGQEYYYETNIHPEYGERWFCTEQEAIANGWRKAYR